MLEISYEMINHNKKTRRIKCNYAHFYSVFCAEDTLLLVDMVSSLIFGCR